MIKALILASLLLLGVRLSAAAQQHPQCASSQDFSDMSEQIFDVFVVPELAQNRATLGISTQERAAPHGVLQDNDMCVALRHATLKVLESRGDAIARDTDMSFLRLGAYYGVFVNLPPVKGGLVVSGGTPMYLFAAEHSPMSTTGSRADGVAADPPKVHFVTDVLRF